MVRVVCSVILTILLVANNVDFGLSACADLGLQPNFVLADYLGLWYETHRSKGLAFEQNSQCVTASYKLGQNDVVVVNNTMRREGSDGKLSDRITDVGTAVAKNDDGTPVFWVKFYDEAPAEYRVLLTDYKNYGIVQSCNDKSVEYFWVLSRSPALTKDAQTAVETFLKNKNIDVNSLELPDQNQERCNSAATLTVSLMTLAFVYLTSKILH